MMRAGVLALVLACLAGGGLRAGAPEVSPRPQARAAATLSPAQVQAIAAAVSSARALPVRPAEAGAGASAAATAPLRALPPSATLAAAPAAAARPASLAPLGPLPRPRARTPGLVVEAMARRRDRARGTVCGDPALQGEEVGRVPGRLRGCGVGEAIKLRAVSGVALSKQAVMDCRTAQSLKAWVERGLIPATRNLGGGPAQIRVAAHYSCRTRNNRPGAKISEHGKGRAIDISGIVLRNGQVISVLRDWGQGRRGRALAQMRRAACGPFGTVLGPGSDRYHDDHFHFDTARHRGGPYCR